MTSISPTQHLSVDTSIRASTPTSGEASAKTAAGAEFSSQMTTTAAENTDVKNVASSMPVFHQRSKSAELSPVQKFEGFVLQSFVENMLPDDQSSFFGEGMAGKVWKSMLAEQIGQEMARTGGIGIADLLNKDPAVAAHSAKPSMPDVNKLTLADTSGKR